MHTIINPTQMFLLAPHTVFFLPNPSFQLHCPLSLLLSRPFPELIAPNSHHPHPTLNPPLLLWLLAMHPKSPPPFSSRLSDSQPSRSSAHGYSLAGPSARWCPVINESFHTQRLSWRRLQAGRWGAVGKSRISDERMQGYSHLRWRWGRREEGILGWRKEVRKKKVEEQRERKVPCGLKFFQLEIRFDNI